MSGRVLPRTAVAIPYQQPPASNVIHKCGAQCVKFRGFIVCPDCPEPIFGDRALREVFPNRKARRIR
jgi:hypothetical protein